MDLLGLTHSWQRVLSRSTLLRLQSALQGHCPKQTLHFVHFPSLSHSGSGSWVQSWAQTRLDVRFVPIPGLSSSGDQVLGEHTVLSGLCVLITSQSWLISFLGVPRISSGELISGCSPPGRCQPSRIPGRRGQQLGASSQLGGVCWSLGLRLSLAFWLWLLHACLSASSGGEGQVCSQLALLWYSLNPLFCELARLRVRAFRRKVLSLSLFIFFFFHLEIPLFGLLLHVCSLRLSSGHSGPGLPLRTNDAACGFLSSPCLLVADTSIWAAQPLAVGVRLAFCVVVFPPSYVALCDSKTLYGPAYERVSYCLETSPP